MTDTMLDERVREIMLTRGTQWSPHIVAGALIRGAIKHLHAQGHNEDAIRILAHAREQLSAEGLARIWREAAIQKARGGQ